MTIPNKLRFVGLFPLLILIFLTGYFALDSYKKYEQSKAFKQTLMNNSKLTHLLTSLGKERDLTAIYLGSSQTNFSNSLNKQRRSTNTFLTETKNNVNIDNDTLLPWLLTFIKEPLYMQSKNYRYFLNDVSKLPKLRIEANTRNSEFESVFFNGYTHLTTAIYNTLLEINDLALTVEISSLAHTLTQLYTVKESIGLERGYVSYFMGKRKAMRGNDLTLWYSLKEKSHIFDLSNVSDTQVHKELKKLLDDQKSLSIEARLSEMFTKIMIDTPHGRYREEVIDWFSLETQKISFLAKAELLVSNKLWNKNSYYMNLQRLKLALSLVFLLVVLFLLYLGSRLNKNIQNNSKGLKNLLNFAVNTKKTQGLSFLNDANLIQSMNLKTSEGTSEAYSFLEDTFTTNNAYASTQTSEELFQEIEGYTQSEILDSSNTEPRKEELPSVREETSSMRESIEELDIYKYETPQNTQAEEYTLTPKIEEPIKEDIPEPKIEPVPAKERRNKRILISKKFILERRVLMKTLDNLGYTYDLLEVTNTLMEMIQTKQHDVIITDVDAIIEDIDSDILFITTLKSKQELTDSIEAHRKR